MKMPSSDSFEAQVKHVGLKNAIAESVEDIFSSVLESEGYEDSYSFLFDPWWEEYGDYIHEYDWSDEIYTVKGYGEAFKPLRESTNAGLAQTATIGGATGFVGGGYRADSAGQDLMDKFQADIDGVVSAGKSEIDTYWDDYYEEITDGVYELLTEMGSFDFNSNNPWFSPIDDYSNDSFLLGDFSLGNDWACINSPQCCVDGVWSEELCPSNDSDLDDDGCPEGYYRDASGMCQYSGVGTAGFNSDIRLKKNVIKVGKSRTGIDIYEFDYINQDGRYRGVIANDLLGTDAVTRDHQGFLMVDYSKIDVPFERIDCVRRF